ncbi:MAG TPA: hypothetical protein VFV38_45045 [Ktedonobacteraceae bacterium]|nr:hypothetical protein [Ktedonobacteraceae bacterium]
MSQNDDLTPTQRDEAAQTSPQADESVARTPQVPWDNEELAAILEMLPDGFHLWIERAVCPKTFRKSIA